MRIGITGGCGFVGSNLAEHFMTAGHDVVVLDNLMREGSCYNLQRLKEQNIEFVHADIRNPEELDALYDCDAILDCAAQTSVIEGENNPAFSFTNNSIGIFNILEIVRKVGIPLIYWASNKVYPSGKINSLPVIEKETRFEWDVNLIKNVEHVGLTISELPKGVRKIKGFNENWPLGLGSRSIYGASKVTGDLWCQEYRNAYDIPIFINRFSCLAGPWQYGMAAQGWYVWFIIASHLGLPISFYGWNGKQVRDVLFIDDVISLIEKQLSKASKKECKGGVYNIGGGIENAISLREHVKTLESIGLKPILKNEKGPQRRCDQIIYISDFSKAHHEFNWLPEINLDVGLKKCLSWVAKNSKEFEFMHKYLK